MNDKKLDAALESIVTELVEGIVEQEEALKSSDAVLRDVERLCEQVEARAGMLEAGGSLVQAEVRGALHSVFDPVRAGLKDGLEQISAMDQLAQVSKGRLTTDAVSALSDLIQNTEAFDQQVPDVITSLLENFNSAREDVVVKRDEITNIATGSLDIAIDSAETLRDTLVEAIPDVVEPVANLVDQEFGQRLTQMTDQADELLNQIEGLVQAAGDALDLGLAEIVNLLEQINAIVEPLDPAFDAFEILQG